MSYPLIEDHGVIGNLNTIALVCSTGSIDFLCFPDFDSPSLFTSLLDKKKGGSFSISPVLDNINYKQMYIPDTCVLLTRFLSSVGVSEVTDFMPVVDQTKENILIRRVTAVKGDITFRMKFNPQFNYARSNHKIQQKENEIIFSSSGDDGIIISFQSSIKVEIKEGSAIADFKLNHGESADFIMKLRINDSQPFGDISIYVDKMLFQTMDYWKEWSSQGKYSGLWHKEVYTSAMILKLFTSKKYGSIIASPTFGLPEHLGGTRNWDYRYCWIRDAAFSMYALINLGYKNEARAFMEWVEKRCEDISKAGRLSIMYTISGEKVPDEIILDSLGGYKNSLPVRIGNDAYNQVQLDIYGELIDSVYLFTKYVEPISYDFWIDLINQANWLKDHWQDKDKGIWEARGEKKNFLYFRLMCWVAFDRMIRIGERLSYPYPPEYKNIRDKIFKSIYDDFWDPQLNVFVQYKGAKSIDAATLLMPLMRFVTPKEKNWLSTLEKIEADLVSDALVFRYRLSDAIYDPITSAEGTFSMCTFWYIECLSKSGQLHKARFYFEKMLGYSNHLGLFAEELSFNGEHLGNFPQAFTHLGLISAAINLNKKLTDPRDLKEESDFW